MIWLLLQVSLCLVLAALAGWFLGWSMRGFRETDRVEDLRQTLHATVDVKNRELSESYRQVEGLQSRSEALERTTRGLKAKLEAARRSDTPETQPSALSPSPGPQPAIAGSPKHTQDHAAVKVLEDDRQRRDTLADHATERRRRAELEAELREKTSTLVSLESEVKSLRRAVDKRAAQVAELESRIIELEPVEKRLRLSEAELKELQASETYRLSPLQEAMSNAPEDQLNAREIRINELRMRVNDLRAELDSARRQHRHVDSKLADNIAGAERLQCEQDELARKLQRQIERNRKQETVNRSVVEALQRELQTLHLEARNGLSADKEIGSHPHQAAVFAGDHEGSGEASSNRGTRIVEYRKQPADLEKQPDSPIPISDRDDLKLIRGVGPAFERLLNKSGITRFAQVAQWDTPDIERFSEALDTTAKRIIREGWVESARKLL